MADDSDPPSSGPTDRDGVDLAVIETLRSLGGDEEPELFAELVHTFLGDSPPRLRAIEKAAQDADAAALERAAHGLKSSSANMGLKLLAELCRQLEAMAVRGETQGSVALAARARAEFVRASSILEDLAS